MGHGDRSYTAASGKNMSASMASPGRGKEAEPNMEKLWHGGLRLTWDEWF